MRAQVRKGLRCLLGCPLSVRELLPTDPNMAQGAWSALQISHGVGWGGSVLTATRNVLITQRSSVQIRPPQPAQGPGTKEVPGPSCFCWPLRHSAPIVQNGRARRLVLLCLCDHSSSGSSSPSAARRALKPGGGFHSALLVLSSTNI